MPLTPGSTFERYEIQSLIGRGGMGEVYRALDTRLHRPVALKVLRTDDVAATTVADAGGVARLLREARAAAALNHANSVAIYELGEAEGISYIAMEFVSGVTLRHYLGEGNVSVETKLAWLVDAARALWAAHRAGLVHRDVKPGNIMVSEEGVVKVLDFGLAKPTSLGKKPGEFQTSMGQVLGTPRYMAPEQLEGAPADAAADQYAFGLTAYELISGKYPGGPLSGPAPLLDGLIAGASAELARTVAKMMARAPADRYATMEAAAHALRACAGGGAWTPEVVRPALHGAQSTAARASDVPTAVQTAAEPESHSREIPVDVELGKGSTLPLGVPFKAAVGEQAAARVAGAPPAAPTSAPNLGKTLPLARPPSNPNLQAPPSSGRASGPGVVSGVYASGNAAARKGAAAATTKRDGSKLWIVLLVIASLIAAGGLAAFLRR